MRYSKQFYPQNYKFNHFLLLFQYLEKRFGNGARLAASLAYTLQMVLYNGIVLYAPALALEALTGISQLAAILSVGK